MVNNNNQLTLWVLLSVLEKNDDTDNEVNNDGNDDNDYNDNDYDDDNPKDS